MEIKLKERLVGALVLVGIAVVVLPWVFDNEKESQQFDSQIPDAPPLPPSRVIELSQPRPLDEREPESGVIAAQTHQESQAHDETPESDLNLAPEESSSEAQTTTRNASASTGSVNEALPVKINEATSKPQLGDAFVIQLGSFSSAENANRLVNDLRAKGLKAYVKLDRSAKPVAHRVLIGPILKRDDAEKMQLKAAQASGLKALVLSYDPLKH